MPLLSRYQARVWLRRRRVLAVAAARCVAKLSVPSNGLLSLLNLMSPNIIGTFPRGVALLDHLHHHVSSLRVEDATGHVRELVTWFLVKACSPLLAVLSDLISSGKVDQMTDPFVRLSYCVQSVIGGFV